MRPQPKLHDVARPYNSGSVFSQPLQETFDTPWRRWFLPRKEMRLMSEEAQRTGGLFIPYPLLGLILTLCIVLGGGLIGLYASVTTMNATMLMRDADQRKALDRMQEQNDVQEQLIRDLRERQAEMRSDVNQLMKKRGGG